MRVGPLLLALPLLVTACSPGDDAAGPDPLPTVSGAQDCPTGAAQTIPAGCVSEGPETRPPVPTERFPATSAEIEAVRVPPLEGDLAGGGNDQDPSLTTRSFTVTVPAGKRLRVTAACNGAAFLEATTEPDSLAEVEMSCFEPGAVSEITVADEVLQKAPKTFVVTVRAPAPSRWYAVAGATSDPLPGG